MVFLPGSMTIVVYDHLISSLECFDIAFSSSILSARSCQEQFDQIPVTFRPGERDSIHSVVDQPEGSTSRDEQHSNGTLVSTDRMVEKRSVFPYEVRRYAGIQQFLH